MDHYVDYDYYKESYGGTLDESAFNSVMVKAQAQVNFYTGNRIFEVTDDVRNAVCACCDILYEEKTQTTLVTSETLDNHSRSYAVSVKKDTDFKREIYDACMLYLKSTGLMYRGLKCTHIR